VNVGALGFAEMINEAFQRLINRQIGELREELAEQGLELQLAHIETRESELVIAATITPKS